ncbi:MAG: Hsp70 family protein [Atopobiaceae bacterium]|nr:Hsp70 family protein [Atopobiaceae bacterium]
MGDQKNTIVGIDLGTTYSCIAAIDELGNPVVGKNRNGGATTPSVVHFVVGRDPKDCEVGEVAKDSAVTEPDRTAQLFKPLMGKRGVVAANIDGVDISPQEASAYVLKKITDDYRERYDREIAGVVITVPAHFGQPEREATCEAGEMAGLDVLGIVQEPVAAAVYYGVCETKDDGAFLVYDLGGGTFDVTAVEVVHADDRDIVDVVCAEGDHELGGRLWDDRIIAYLEDEYAEQKGACEFSPFSKQALRSAAEEAKQRLSETDETAVNLMLDKGPARVMLSRETFDELTSDLLANTINLTRKALEAAREDGCDIKSILLVGGSTWMPQVKEALAKNFPDLELKRTDPDEAVAKGAAICAAKHMIDRLGAKRERGKHAISVEGIDLSGMSERGLELGFVTSKSYGVKARYKDGVERISNLILKNCKIDKETGIVSEDKTFRTLEAYPQQVEVELEVYENDEEAPSARLNDGRMVVSQTFDLKELRLPERAPIVVTFVLDEEGLLTVQATEPESGRSIDFEKKVLGLSPQEVAQAKARVTGIAAE